MDLMSTLSAISSAKEFAALIIGRKIDSAVTEKAIELQNAIIGLQSAILEMQAENQRLMVENHGLQQSLEQKINWDAEKARHQLKEVAKGVFVYELKDEFKLTNLSPWLCANCFDSQRKSILQRQGQDYGGTHYQCHACKAVVYDHNDVATPSFG